MSAWQETLVPLLQAETDSATALLECLLEEESALQGQRPELLEQTINRKLLLLKEMTQHAINRTELLEAKRLATDPESLHKFMNAEGEPLSGLWHRLLGLASRLEQQNQVNGSVIQLCKQRSQMALEILTQPIESGKTYGKQGYAQSDSTPFTSVKA